MVGSSLLNGWTFVALGIAGFFYFCLLAVGGAVTADDSGLLAFGILLFASGLICEWRTMPGRLLGAPIWAWGALLALLGLVKIFGPLALAPAVGAGLLGGLVYWRQRRRQVADRWPAAEAALDRARDAAEAADLGGTWAALEAALILPADPEPSRLRGHLGAIAALLRATFGALLSAEQRERLEALGEALSGGQGPVEEADRAWIAELVTRRGI
ncbi:MAG: hypothetical protein P1V51_11040 [Deltaproteobacteria bacterium]|nr:hypothetical protein [Deltaproteobacteria bacterium]